MAKTKQPKLKLQIAIKRQGTWKKELCDEVLVHPATKQITLMPRGELTSIENIYWIRPFVKPTRRYTYGAKS